MTPIGIDSGKGVAIVRLDANGHVLYAGLVPTIGKEYDLATMRAVLMQYHTTLAGLEKVHSMPKRESLL